MTNHQGFLGAQGIKSAAAKLPFWKPSNAKKYVLLVDVREPEGGERVREFEVEGRKVKEKVLLIATVKEHPGTGPVKEWAITSVRCVRAINALPADTKLPAWIHVERVGQGVDQDYVIGIGALPDEQARLPVATQ